MPAFTVDWFIGSITIPLQSFTVTATGATVAADDYYLDHSASARSLMRQVGVSIVAAVGGTATVEFLRNRRIRITLSVAQAITWGMATQLRDLLGFTGDLGSATVHTATNVSPLLWSPGYTGNPQTIRGKAGYLVPHQSIVKSDDGTQSHTYHLGEETWQEYSWSHIDPARLMVTGTAAAGGGTYYEFHRQCAMLGVRFNCYQGLVEDDSDSSTAVGVTTELGPYVLRPEARRGDWFRRNIPNAEISSPLELPLHVVAEYA